MNRQKLEFLVEVAKTGSLSIAAQNLHVTQSGISQAITKIEEELGIKIFERSRLGASLTEEGTTIVNKANEILLKYEELVEEARQLVDSQSSDLRVSTVPDFITYLIKHSMELKNLHAHSTIEIIENMTENTIEMVQKNKVEIGLIALYDGILNRLDGLQVDVIHEGKMKVYASSDSPFALSKTITPEEILKQKIVLYNGDYVKWFVNQFQHTFGNLDILYTSNHTEELIRSVSNGLAISFAPDIAIKNNPFVLEGKMVDVEIIHFKPTIVSLASIRPKKKRLSKIERQFIHFLKFELLF
jgi:DNA-binding transcriptional LysR family regulator